MTAAVAPRPPTVQRPAPALQIPSARLLSTRAGDLAPASAPAPEAGAPSPMPWWKADPDAESSWTAQFEDGTNARPGPMNLHRSDDRTPAEMLEQGLPPRGSNFDVAAHVNQRSDANGSNDDALYGAAVYASRQTDSGGHEGPLWHHGRYLHVLKDAYAVSVGAQRTGDTSVVEHEEVLHALPPHKWVASLDKQTGEIQTHPDLPPDEAAAQRDRLGRLDHYYETMGGRQPEY